MSLPPPFRPKAPSLEEIAAQWVLRRDRGLTAAEQDELSQWLAADPRHGAALALHRWGWDELDRLTGLQTSLSPVADPDLLAPPRHVRRALARRRWAVGFISLAAAAAVVVGVILRRSPPRSSEAAAVLPPATSLAAPCERLELPDGSVVELNRGAIVRERFTATERRVRIEQGEASFDVAKDPARPFIVEAAGCEARAVGTAFNVRIDPAAVEVLVTEGKVAVSSRSQASVAQPPVPLAAGEWAVVPHAPAARPRIATLSPPEIEARLAWQPRLLDFTDAPLAQLVAEFNRRNVVRLTIADPALAEIKLSAAFRSDNVEGFVKLMESAFGMRAVWRSEREIALHRAR